MAAINILFIDLSHTFGGIGPIFMPLRHKRVLLVDDNQHMRTLVATILLGLGCKEIAEAGDGATALEMMRDLPVDVVIVDYKMSGIDGIEFVRMLRTAKDSPGRYLPILMMTGSTTRRVVLAAKQAGVSAFVAKPVSTRTLADRLAYSLANPMPGETSDAYLLS